MQTKSGERLLEFIHNVGMDITTFAKHVGKALIKNAIDGLCCHLRIKKINHRHQPNNKIVVFFYRGGWVTLKYCGSCYVDIHPTIERPNSISFIVRDGRDILEKLQKYKIVFSDFTN